MIWDNGYIKFQTADSEMFDDKGNPIETGGEWSDYIPCGYEEQSTLTATTAENSPYVAQSFKIRIKLQPTTERLKLYRKDKSLIGEYVVRSINDYQYIDQTHLQCSRG